MQKYKELGIKLNFFFFGIFNDIYIIVYNVELIFFINFFRYIFLFEMNVIFFNGVVFYMVFKYQNFSKLEFIVLEIVDSYFWYYIKCSYFNVMLIVLRIVVNDVQFYKVNIYIFI